MARADKVAAVAELKESFSDSAAVVLTDYRGLSVQDLQDLRRSMKGEATYSVAKNTLAIIAAREAGIEGLDEQLVGPTALTFINGDVATVAKGLRDFAKEHPALIIKGGVMDGSVLDADSVKKLANLESREVLLAKLAGAMNASLQQAVFLFAAPLSQAARALGALEAKAQADPSVIGGTGSAPAPEAAPDAQDASPAVADAGDSAEAGEPTESADAPEAPVAETADAAEAVGDTEDAPAASSTEAAADAAADTE